MTMDVQNEEGVQYNNAQPEGDNLTTITRDVVVTETESVRYCNGFQQG